jgi:antitoxin component of RelBE/YafQ-DinJ toxin-antitoxin module
MLERDWAEQYDLIQVLTPMSQTIYARVPDNIKEAADSYAATRGVTLASAVSDLLDRGLQAAADEQSISELERRAADLTAEVDTLRQRDHAISSAYQALAQRIAQPVGACPSCSGSVSGHDLLVNGRCANAACAASLSELLSRPTNAVASGKGGLDDGEFKMMLGALGMALGIAYLAQQAGGGG